MLPPPPTGVKKLGATDHVMLGSGMPVATQVRVAGLVSFTTKVSSVMSTSGGSEQGGEGEGCSHFCMHSTRHKLLRYCLLIKLEHVPHVLYCKYTTAIAPHVDQCV